MRYAKSSAALIAGLICATCAGMTGAILINRGEKIDRDRLTVHRLDIVDANGVTRLTLAAPTPDPLVNGKRVQRRYPVSGLAIFDEKGNERGGIGVADIPGGAPVLALDHRNFDAIGWKVLPDGTVDFGINGSGARSSQRVRLRVSADGTPSIDLDDANEHPRLRLTVSADGAGKVQFLDENGKIVRTVSPSDK